MKNLHPLLQRAFTLAREESQPPPADLEERVLADWRNARFAPAVDFLRPLRWALLGAAAVLVVTCGVSLRLLNDVPDSSTFLANSALLGSLHHD